MRTDNFRKVAVSAALKAGSHIAKHVGLRKTVRYKGEINVVTDVDRASEDIVVSAIKKHYPGHSFLAEEKSYAKKSADFTWIIDPLDGTTNFLHGFPFFCVSIALAKKGDVLTGVVYDPARNELFYAEKGKGAFLNEKRIRVSRIKHLKKALIATGFTYNIRKAKNKNITNFVKFLKRSQAVRRAGSAALDLSYVASGRFDGFWEYHLNPWDIAAGILIVKEAGGKVTRVDGKPFGLHNREILASNSKLHSQMANILKR